jgi:hypothetical protein
MPRLPKVYNKHHRDAPPDAVNIMRPNTWGNPYTFMDNAPRGTVRVASRAEAIQRFEKYLRDCPDLIAAVKSELRGKSLVCCCKPLPCHGDVLLRIANEG